MLKVVPDEELGQFMVPGNYLATVVLIFIFQKMTPVVLLAKSSVFELLQLESDIQQTKGTFCFLSLLQTLVSKEVEEDWTGVQRCFIAVCNFGSMLQYEAELPVLFTFCLPVL